MVSLPRTPETYRKQAEDCERVAAEASFPETRETLLYVAARWRSFADEDEAEVQSSPDRSACPPR
jgi:hypothetical protein